MSQYTINRVELRYDRLKAACSDLLAQARDCDCNRLLTMTGEGLNTESVSDLHANWARLDALAGARRLLQLGATQQLRQAERLTIESDRASRDGNLAKAGRLALQAQDALHHGVVSTVSKVRRDERAVVTTAAETSLLRMGFHVSVEHGRRSSGIWATRGHKIVAALVQDGGVTELDIAGISGGGCAVTMNDLQAELDREGVVVDVRRRIDHGDERGGSLIQRAGQTGAATPALGLVEQYETGVEVRLAEPSKNADKNSVVMPKTARVGR